jgi:hypothetical protein
MDVTANGQSRGDEKRPARWHLTAAIVATTMLRISTVGFMTEDVMPNRAMAAE